MATKKTKELKNLKGNELTTKLRELEAQLFDSKMKQVTGQLTDSSLMWRTRKAIARVKTFQTQEKGK